MTDPRSAAVGAALALALALGACTSDDEPAPAPTTAATASSTPTPTAPPTATAAPVPPDLGCYRLSYDAAVSPTSDAAPVRCRTDHTSQTYLVGRVDNVVDGHLLAIDSTRVQQKVATDCPAALGDMIGGTLRDQRLSMLRAVWFTPSLDQAGRGASWFRCDVVALAGSDELVVVNGTFTDALATPEGRERFAMCGTASPDAPDFERVPCSAPHSWRAFEVLPLEPGAYPGRDAVVEAGEAPCEDAAAAVADDPLDYDWAFEGPDADQWAAGQTFVRCWTPD